MAERGERNRARARERGAIERNGHTRCESVRRPPHEAHENGGVENSKTMKCEVRKAPANVADRRHKRCELSHGPFPVHRLWGARVQRRFPEPHRRETRESEKARDGQTAGECKRQTDSLTDTKQTC